MPFTNIYRHQRDWSIAAALLAAMLLTGCASSPPCSEQPLAVTQSVMTLTHPDGRQTQVTLWQPTQPGQYPLAMFSHGAYSAPERYDALLGPLAAMGLVVAAPLHIDSELIATDPPAAPATVWQTRKQDVAALLAAPKALRDNLRSGVNLSAARVAAGHSYGAFGAQVAAGAAAAGDTPGVIQPGVEVVLAFSPPGLLPGFIEAGAWNAMDRPQLLLTGTDDILPGFMEDWRTHMAAWQQAPEGDQWLWVGAGVDHYFGKVFGRLQREVPAQRQEFDQALATTQKFLATYLPSHQAGRLAVCSNPIATSKTALASIERR